MILSQLEDYSEEDILMEIKHTKQCLRLARENYEFEEQTIQKEKLELLNKELGHRSSIAYFNKPDSDRAVEFI